MTLNDTVKTATSEKYEARPISKSFEEFIIRVLREQAQVESEGAEE